MGLCIAQRNRNFALAQVATRAGVVLLARVCDIHRHVADRRGGRSDGGLRLLLNGRWLRRGLDRRLHGGLSCGGRRCGLRDCCGRCGTRRGAGSAGIGYGRASDKCDSKNQHTRHDKSAKFHETHPQSLVTESPSSSLRSAPAAVHTSGNAQPSTTVLVLPEPAGAAREGLAVVGWSADRDCGRVC